MKFYPCLSAILVFMMACSSGPKIPETVIHPNDMSNLLWDMSLAEDLVNHKVGRDSTVDVNREIAGEYEKVFEFHKVSKQDFLSSYQFYKTHPPLYKVLLDTLHARSDRRRSDIFRSRS